MDYFIFGMLAFMIGVTVGMFLLALAQAEMSKCKDYMMIDGKMRWVKRTEWFKEELEKLKQSRLKDTKG